MDALTELDDEALIRGLDESRRREREELPLLLAHLAEVARRGLHLDLGHRSLFELCVERLRYSEGAAARRVDAARAASRFPALYSLLRDGELTLTCVSRLSSHLTPENFDEAVSRAAGRKQREIEELIVDLAARKVSVVPAPEPQAPEPEPSLFEAAAAVATAAATAPDRRDEPFGSSPPSPKLPRRRDVVRLESPGVVRGSFQADATLRRKLDCAKELLFRACPGGRLEDVLGRVLDDYLSRRDPFRKKPAIVRPGRDRESRRIPQWVKDQSVGGTAAAAPSSPRTGAAARRPRVSSSTTSLRGRKAAPRTTRGTSASSAAPTTSALLAASSARGSRRFRPNALIGAPKRENATFAP